MRGFLSRERGVGQLARNCWAACTTIFCLEIKHDHAVTASVGPFSLPKREPRLGLLKLDFVISPSLSLPEARAAVRLHNFVDHHLDTSAFPGSRFVRCERHRLNEDATSDRICTLLEDVFAHNGNPYQLTLFLRSERHTAQTLQDLAEATSSADEAEETCSGSTPVPEEYFVDPFQWHELLMGPEAGDGVAKPTEGVVFLELLNARLEQASAAPAIITMSGNCFLGPPGPIDAQSATIPVPPDDFDKRLQRRRRHAGQRIYPAKKLKA